MRLIFSTLFFLLGLNAMAQEALTYQKPPKEILDLVDVKLAPRTLMDSKNSNMVLIYRDTYKSIDELSKKEMRLGGLRIDPKINIGSRVTYYNDVKINRIKDSEIESVKGLPKNPKLTNFRWSPNEKFIAMTHTTNTSVELWLLDVNNAKAKKISNLILNANMGDVVNWSADSQFLLVKSIPKDRGKLIDVGTAVPSGPTISVSDGKKAQNRTYQDLLKDKNDEFNFEQLARSDVYKVSLNGKTKKLFKAGMYGDIAISPDGEYVLVTEYSKPFSYLVPYSRFPHTVKVYSIKGKQLKTIADVPLLEDLPKGFMAVQKGLRGIRWRADKPAELVLVNALDDGDPAKEVERRDSVLLLSAPFDGQPREILKTKNRFYRINWGSDNIAIAQDYWWNTRNTKSYLVDPSEYSEKLTIISDRNYQDSYNDPGSFTMQKNQYGWNVLALKNNNVYLRGDGHSDKGQFPFLDQLNLSTQEKTRLYQSNFTDKLESLYDYDIENNRLLVRIESKNDYPNYYFRKLSEPKDEQLQKLTDFVNPFVSIQDVSKQVIQYQRDDGLELSGTLYLPTDYKKGKKYPMILWAYPREYKDKSSASQNTQNPNEFIYPYYGSPIYWITKGYVVLDSAAFPIVGVGKEEPNDSFRAQLVANAKAAIDAVDKLGVVDRKRVAVGGHSYGAFMVANLLSHSDLFAAGIARSGAYNRTLTPFGFQSEERSYWEAPDVYNTMSPFMHADKMKTPLLLIHGEADNNSGTYPLQSERYFNALKGLGAPVRLVMLPKESHGYRAKESILHVLWEQDRWLDIHVKNRNKNKSKK